MVTHQANAWGWDWVRRSWKQAAMPRLGHERLDVGHMRSDPRNPALATVSSWLLRPQGDPVRVEWRIRREGGRYQIADVVVEGA